LLQILGRTLGRFAKLADDDGTAGKLGVKKVLHMAADRKRRFRCGPLGSTRCTLKGTLKAFWCLRALVDLTLLVRLPATVLSAISA
jgi:hypothetical protein